MSTRCNQIIGRSIKIKSIDRTGSTDTYNNFDVDLSGPALNDETESDVIVKSVALPITTYNVNKYTNTLNWVEDNGTPLNCSITVPANNYTGSQLATTLSADMTTESSENGLTLTWIVTYDYQSAKFTFKWSGNAASNGVTFKFESESAMTRLLGFLNTDFSLPTIDTDYLSDHIAQLHAMLMVSVHWSGYAGGASSTAGGKINDILFTLQADKQFGEIVHWDPIDSKEAFRINQLSGHHRIRLTTDYGNFKGELPLENQSEWEMVLVAFNYRGEAKRIRIDNPVDDEAVQRKRRRYAGFASEREKRDERFN